MTSLSILVTVQIVMQTYTVYEAARLLNCTSQWIRVLLAEQRLDGAQKVDGQWRIPEHALLTSLQLGTDLQNTVFNFGKY